MLLKLNYIILSYSPLSFPTFPCPQSSRSYRFVHRCHAFCCRKKDCRAKLLSSFFCSFYSPFRAVAASTISHHLSLFLLSSSSIPSATFTRFAFNVSSRLYLGRPLGLLPLISPISTCLQIILSLQKCPAHYIRLLS